MSEKDLYCQQLSSRISELTILRGKYQENLETALDDFDFKRDYEYYKDIQSDMKYNHSLYKRDCIGFRNYLASLFK